MVKLYTTHCPKCRVIESKLKQKNIEYDICDDIAKMQELGFKSTPMLQLEDGTFLDFSTAVKYINELK